MGNGITWSIKSTDGDYVVIQEHIDLTHPNCPVVGPTDATWIMLEKHLTLAEAASLGLTAKTPVTPPASQKPVR